MTATTTAPPCCPTPGCTPVRVATNRRTRRRLHSTATTLIAHADHCPFAGGAGAATAGWRAAGRIRSPLRDGDDGHALDGAR